MSAFTFFRTHARLRSTLATAGMGWLLASSLSGCAVVSVASTAVSITAGAVGLAADAAIGTAKIVGKGVGKAADALLDDEPDTSGITVRYRDPSASTAGASSGHGAGAASGAVTTPISAPVAPPSALAPTPLALPDAAPLSAP